MALAGRGSQLAGRFMSALRPMQACRSLTTQTLPDLPYEYNALEPVISAEIMKLHHSKHHNTYITTLNQSYEKYADAEAKGDVAKMIELQQAIKFNGGGKIMISERLSDAKGSLEAESCLHPYRTCEPQHILAESHTTKSKFCTIRIKAS